MGKIDPPVSLPVGSGAPPAPEPDPPHGRARRLMAIALEGVISLGLALLCFGVLIWVLDTVFPSGMGLRRQFTVERKPHDPWGLPEVPGASNRPATAVLRVFSNEVRLRAADQIAWNAAREGGEVHEGDAVQTRRDGRALLRFTNGSTLRLGRNSLLVVRDGSDAPVPTYEVPQGELWGTLPERGDDPLQLHVPNGDVVVKPGNGSGKQPDFKVVVGPDRSSIVAVYRGSASVTTPRGTQQVKENHYVAVDTTGKQTSPELLPEAPRPGGPVPGARYVYRDTPPQFAFQWDRVGFGNRYHLVVARDAAFQSVVLDRTLFETRLEFGALGAGHYHWRVSTLRAQVEGRPSSPSSFEIVRDEHPPKLVVHFPEGAVSGAICTVTGVSDPGSRVFVAGTPAPVGTNGNFSSRVPLKRGMNVVVVESFDPAGNTAYSSKIVEARY